MEKRRHTVDVVFCKDCIYGRVYDDGGFECENGNLDFYAPYYNAATYYCADGRLEGENGHMATQKKIDERDT